MQNVLTSQQLHCPTATTLSHHSSSSKVGQFSFEYCPPSNKTSSVILYQAHFGRLACHPTFSLSLCYFFPSLFTESLAPFPTPVLWGGSVFDPTPLVLLDCDLLFMLFSFVGEGLQSAQGLHSIMFLGGG
jgi:hypothetical protein